MDHLTLTDYIVGIALLLGLVAVGVIGLDAIYRAYLHSRHRLLKRWSFVRETRLFSERGKLATLRRWIERRFSTKEIFGLNLTIGAIIIFAGCWIFGEMTDEVLDDDLLSQIDQRIATFLHTNALAGVTEFMKLATHLGSAAFIACISTLVGIYLIIRRGWYRLITLALATIGGALLNLLLKSLIGRARPGFEDPILTLSNFSFPSGHTMGATILFGTLAAFIAISGATHRIKVTATTIAACLIALVAITRVYLGAHFLSDVLAAIVAGLAWLALCFTVVDTLRRRNSL